MITAPPATNEIRIEQIHIGPSQYAVMRSPDWRGVRVRYVPHFGGSAPLVAELVLDDSGHVTDVRWVRQWLVWSSADQRGAVLGPVENLIARHYP